MCDKCAHSEEQVSFLRGRFFLTVNNYWSEKKTPELSVSKRDVRKTQVKSLFTEWLAGSLTKRAQETHSWIIVTRDAKPANEFVLSLQAQSGCGHVTALFVSCLLRSISLWLREHSVWIYQFIILNSFVISVWYLIQVNMEKRNATLLNKATEK